MAAKLIIIRYESADGLSLKEEWKGEFPVNSDIIVRSCIYPLTNKREQGPMFPSRRYERVEKTHYGYRYREMGDD